MFECSYMFLCVLHMFLVIHHMFMHNTSFDLKSTSKEHEGSITTYPPVVWPKFKLSTCGLKFDTLPT